MAFLILLQLMAVRWIKFVFAVIFAELDDYQYNSLVIYLSMFNKVKAYFSKLGLVSSVFNHIAL